VPPVHYTRRSFLETTTSTLVALGALPSVLARDPYAPWVPRPGPATGTPGAVRVRGVVRARGRGVAGVALSDGLRVVSTGRDGRFELVSDTGREFVSLSLPSGYAVPTSATGTARLHRPFAPDARGEMSAAFDLTPLADGRADARHACLLLADVQTQDEQEMRWFHEQTVPDVLETIARLDRETFGIACGDIMYDKLEFYPDYERGVKGMGVPFFQVVGNHDLDLDGRTDEASTATFARHFGPGHYSFDRGEVHYAVLDDVFWHGAGYFGYVGADQLAWLTADLARVERGRTVIVALHIPVLGSRHVRDGQESPGTSTSVNNREALYRLLEPYRAHILSGHMHEHEHVFEQGTHELVSGTVCGAWWSGPICADGTPNGYTVLEVDGSSVTWRYKCTGHPAEHQIRPYPRGADPQSPHEIVANVWDWDPEWTVTWYENGEPRGPMARRVGRDPRSVELHTGPSLPPRRKWVEPYPTAHLFYAPAAAGARALRVEARDRFGRTYSAEVPARG
jgi:calcineurin-like phosphoesterase family protein